jgi:aspartyl-tRNA synthetase
MSTVERTFVKDLKAGEARICGFVEKIRDQKSIQFVIVKDVSGRVQVTVFKPDLPEVAATFSGVTAGSVVEIVGKVVDAPNVKLGGESAVSNFVNRAGIEIIPKKVEVLSLAKLSPIDEKTGPELAMDYRWIDLRDDKKREMFQIMTRAEHEMREFLIANRFIEVHTPKICEGGTEGGAEVFEVKYYNRKAYLTQSPQLYKQMAMSAGFERYFEVSTNYRAEKSYTSRHATEFFSLDVEMSFIRDHHEVMDLEEALLRHLFDKAFGQKIKKFPRVSLLESYDLLKKEKNYEVPRASKGDLDPEAERLLCEISREKYGSDFIFITDYPASTRAFYTKRHEGDAKLSKSFDLLYKGVEITSGAQREHNAEKLVDNIKAKGIDVESLRSYVQFFEYGCPPHGGFAIGLARLFARYFDLPSVKDAVFLFRGPDRLTP